MDINELIDRAKDKANLETDYKLAKAIGLSQAGIVSSWRKGKRHPSNEEAVQLATLAGLDEMQVIAEIELRTAKNEKKQLFWKNYLESRGITACLTMSALAFAIVITPQNSEAIVLHNKNYSDKKEALSPVPYDVQQKHLLYIMRISE
jgi:hypothetical protein